MTAYNNTNRRITRRHACLAFGSALGAGVLALAGCSPDEPAPQAQPLQAPPAETPQISETADAPVGQTPAARPAPTAAPYAIVRTEDERRAQSTSVNDVTPGRHVCFLTFDDGPSTNTERILGILNSFGIKATWFVKGNCGHLDKLPAIWSQGNQVAIHTYTHEYEQIYASTDAYWADLQACGDAIQQQIGHFPTLVRFPGGSVNDFNYYVRDAIISQMHASGFHYFDWNVSCGDGADHTADELVYYTVSEASGCNSCCVLMHDSAAKDTTVEALPQIIQYFVDNGFEFDVLLADTFGYHF